MTVSTDRGRAFAVVNQHVPIENLLSSPTAAASFARLEAFEENYIRFFGLFATVPGCTFVRSHITLLDTGTYDPALNGVFRTRLPKEELPRAIAEIAGFFREVRQVPITWRVGPGTTSRQTVLHMLRRLGLREMDPLPVLALAVRARHDPTPSSGTVHQVTNGGELDVWFTLYRRGFEVREASAELCKEAYRCYQGEALTHFIVSHHGRPVAISSLFSDNGSFGIYNVATLPEHRRRGFGREATFAAIRKARELGADEVLLSASKSGLPLYQEMGFSLVGEIEQFTAA